MSEPDTKKAKIDNDIVTATDKDPASCLQEAILREDAQAVVDILVSNPELSLRKYIYRSTRLSWQRETVVDHMGHPLELLLRMKNPISLEIAIKLVDITHQTCSEASFSQKFTFHLGTWGVVDPGVVRYLHQNLRCEQFVVGISGYLLSRCAPAQLHVVKELLEIDRDNFQGARANGMVCKALDPSTCPIEILEYLVDEFMATQPARIKITGPGYTGCVNVPRVRVILKMLSSCRTEFEFDRGFCHRSLTTEAEDFFWNQLSNPKLDINLRELRLYGHSKEFPAFLQSNRHIEELHWGFLDQEPDLEVVFGSLRDNTRLKRLVLHADRTGFGFVIRGDPNPILSQNAASSAPILEHVFAHHNLTLGSLTVGGNSFLSTQVRHLLELNKYGRAQLRVEGVSVAVLVHLLSKVVRCESNLIRRQSTLFGLLMESVGLWTG